MGRVPISGQRVSLERVATPPGPSMAGQESHAHSSDQTSDHRRFNKGNGAAWRWGVQDKGGRGGLSWPLALVRSCDCETRTQIAANAIVVGRTPVQGSSACLRTEACLTSSGCSGLLRWRRKSAVQGWPTGGFGLLPGSSLCAGSAHRVLSTGQVPGCGVSSSRLQAGRRLYCASGSLAPALGEGLAVSSEHSDVVSQDVRMYRRKR